MTISLSDLKYFVETANTLNLSRASERLGISQPSLSVALQKLETSIGAPLFVRSRKGVTLTQEGKQALSHIRGLIETWESLRVETGKSTQDVRGTYRVGCHSSLAGWLFPKVLPQFFSDYPNVELQMVHDLSRKITEGVIDLRIDFAIVVNPVRHPDLVIKKLDDNQVTFWISKKPSRLQDPHSGEAILIYDPNLLQSEELIKRARKSDIRYRRLLTASSLEFMAMLAARGTGIAILPSQIALAQHSPGLVPIQGAPSLKDEICLIYRTENRNVRTIQVLSDRLTTVLLKGPPRT